MRGSITGSKDLASLTRYADHFYFSLLPPCTGKPLGVAVRIISFIIIIGYYGTDLLKAHACFNV